MNAVVSVPRTMQTIVTGWEQTLQLLRYKSKLFEYRRGSHRGFLLEAVKQVVGLFTVFIGLGTCSCFTMLKPMTKWVSKSSTLAAVNQAESIYTLSLDNWNGSSAVCCSLPILLIHATVRAAIQFADRLVLTISDFKMQGCCFASCPTWERLLWNHRKRSVSAINWMECWQWHNSVSGLY